MAYRDDFKLLSIKCLKYYDLLKKEFNVQDFSWSDKEKERLGFYIFMLELICNIKDISDIAKLITDKDFNRKIFNIFDDDFGADAIFIDEDNNFINIFNFKYKEKYSSGKQQRASEANETNKFLSAIDTRRKDGMNGKIKENYSEIIKRLDSLDIWKIKYYFISNETVELPMDNCILKLLENEYDLDIIVYGLPTISKMMALRPNPINASLYIRNDDIFAFKEDGLSSAVSYICQLSANDLIRITCNNKDYRNKYNMEDYSILHNNDMEYSVLFDNVRGYITKSKFNSNIINVLENEPSKFFMYNNGLTFIANNIKSDISKPAKKTKLDLNDFQVVNGGQTLRTIHKYNQLDPKNIETNLADCKVLIRIFNISSDNNNARDKIAEYTNSQNSISNIDLKSLDSIQLKIEQYLDNFNIIYSRKIGDLGLSNKEYCCKISMEKFGQILFSIQGFPEKASNSKKQIFDKYYEQIFKNNFRIENSVTYIKTYFKVSEIYNSLYEGSVSDQKLFYIMYLLYKTNLEIEKVIPLFEKILDKFFNEKNNELSKARILIRKEFKDYLDAEIEQVSTDYLFNNNEIN